MAGDISMEEEPLRQGRGGSQFHTGSWECRFGRFTPVQLRLSAQGDIEIDSKVDRAVGRRVHGHGPRCRASHGMGDPHLRSFPMAPKQTPLLLYPWYCLPFVCSPPSQVPRGMPHHGMGWLARGLHLVHCFPRVHAMQQHAETIHGPCGIIAPLLADSRRGCGGSQCGGHDSVRLVHVTPSHEDGQPGKAQEAQARTCSEGRAGVRGCGACDPVCGVPCRPQASAGHHQSSQRTRQASGGVHWGLPRLLPLWGCPSMGGL